MEKRCRSRFGGSAGETYRPVGVRRVGVGERRVGVSAYRRVGVGERRVDGSAYRRVGGERRVGGSRIGGRTWKERPPGG